MPAVNAPFDHLAWCCLILLCKQWRLDQLTAFAGGRLTCLASCNQPLALQRICGCKRELHWWRVVAHELTTACSASAPDRSGAPQLAPLPPPTCLAPPGLAHCQTPVLSDCTTPPHPARSKHPKTIGFKLISGPPAAPEQKDETG